MNAWFKIKQLKWIKELNACLWNDRQMDKHISDLTMKSVSVFMDGQMEGRKETQI